MMSSTTKLIFLLVIGYEAGKCVCPSVTESSLDVIQYTTSGPESQVLVDFTGDGAGVRPIDKGLSPLYFLTNGFLNLIHPSSKGDWIDDPRFDKAFRDGDILAGVEIIYELVRSDWKFWAGHYLGFTIVIVLGIVFVVAMPIVGLVLCCCRLRGRCGARPKHGKKNSDGWKRTALAILLIVLTTVMAAGVVAMFMTNEVLRQQTSAQLNLHDTSSLNPEMGLLPAFVSSLRRIEKYIFQTFESIKNAIVVPVKNQVTLVRTQLLEFPEKVRERLKEYLDPGRVFAAATSLSDSLKEIAADLGIVKEYMDALSVMQSRLNSSILQTKFNILNALPSSCDSSAECSQLKSKVSNFNVTVDFSQSENASSQVSIIRSIINSDFQTLIEEGKVQFKNMTDMTLNGARETIKEKTNTFLSELDKKLDDSLKAATKTIDEMRSEIFKTLLLNDTVTFLLKTAWHPVETFGNFRYYVGIGLSCVLLLIVACFYFGLCFGFCGEAAGEDARFCNRGVGASFLTAGIGFTFVFASLLMAVAILLFVFGGASYTEICRPMLHQENKAVVKVGERVMLKDTKLNFTLLSALSECEDDRTIYDALNLGEALDIMKDLDQMQRFIADSVGGMDTKIQMNFSSVVIAKKEIVDMLTRLRSVTLSDFPFSSFDVSLSKPATNANVTSLASELSQFSKNTFLDGSQRSALLLESERLRNISSSLIDPMMNKTKQFKEFLEKFKEKIVPRPGVLTFVNKSDDLINSLMSTQQFIRTNLSGLISNHLVRYVREIVDNSVTFINQIKHELQHSVGKCRVLYDIYRAVTVATCSSFLSPFNGYWFSILWCLVLSIPSLILSVHLIALYRKRKDGSVNDSKSLDDPMPWPRRREIPVFQRGHQNPVYDGSDDHWSTPDLTQPLTPLGRVLSDPRFLHPLYSSQTSFVRPGHRHPQHVSTFTRR